MVRSRSTPARRGPVRTPRRRSRWESRPGRLALTGWLLIAVAFGVTAVAQGGGGGARSGPADTALPSRPAAGPHAGESAPGDEEVPDNPEDVPTDPETVPQDVPDESEARAPQRRAPQRPAPAPEAPPTSDAPEDVPDEVPADLPAREPEAVDPAGDDWYGTDPDSSSEEALPDEEALPEDGPLLAPAGDDTTEAVPFTSDETAAAEEWRGDGHRYGGADRVDGDSPDATTAARAPQQLRSHRSGGHTPTILRDSPSRDRYVVTGGASTTRARDRHGVGDPGDRYRSAPVDTQPGYLVEHTRQDSGGHVAVPSGMDRHSDSYGPGSVTYVGE